MQTTIANALKAQGRHISVDDGESITVGKVKIQILHTPGHTPDGICLLVDGKVLTGDNPLVAKTIVEEAGGRVTNLDGTAFDAHAGHLLASNGRLHDELGLPVYILTDGDPWGMHIAMVIISGSANAAHLRELTTPDARWSGVWASDIVDYKLPSDPLTEMDVKRLYELQKDPRYRDQRGYYEKFLVKCSLKLQELNPRELLLKFSENEPAREWCE
jgi:hypothetical protein